jgi:predicted nucleic acid-binding protein
VVVVDTDVLIDAVQAGRELQLQHVGELIRSGEFAVSPITVFELLQANRTHVGMLEQFHALLASATVVDVTRDAAEMAAALNRYLEGRGERIGEPDTLIAGTCLDAGLPILTRNARHFERVPGLEVLVLE